MHQICDTKLKLIKFVSQLDNMPRKREESSVDDKKDISANFMFVMEISTQKKLPSE